MAFGRKEAAKLRDEWLNSAAAQLRQRARQIEADGKLSSEYRRLACDQASARLREAAALLCAEVV